MRVDYSSPLVELVADFYDFDVRFTAPRTLASIGAGLVSAIQQANRSLITSRYHRLTISPSICLENWSRSDSSMARSRSPCTPLSTLSYAADEMAQVCGQTLDCMGKIVAPYPFPELQW